jgi:hypothetical protein
LERGMGAMKEQGQGVETGEGMVLKRVATKVLR